MPAQSLQTLFMASRPALLRFMQLRGVSAGEAEDLVQDLFLKLEGLTIGPIADPRAYLYRMADNLLLDRRRAAARRVRREELWSQVRPGSPASPIDPAAAADDRLIAQQQLVIVESALASLPARTVEIFRRFRIDGERQKHIAADFGISVSAVEKHLQRAYEIVLVVKAQIDEENEPRRRLGKESESDAN
ncbi:sigma-70 family RNA polymerase sigma factor [Sphingomonas sp.]|uniref:RNA polymerase sigma factor n=1 Tax=Sphingomonas sp. TaxID=28214 RepID=UPI00286B2EAE|nr:sigma-70 family RNA polymerase sigma factor [Sphingomonas sp.]